MTWSIAGANLANYGVRVTAENGILGMAGIETEVMKLRGRDRPSYATLRRATEQASLSLTLEAASASALLTNWRSLVMLVHPAKGFQALTRSDVSGKRLLVRSVAMPFARQAPEVHTLSTTLVFDRYPFWQGSSATTEAATDADLVLANPGDLTAEPVWTVTVIKAAGLPTGYTWTVNGMLFQYTGALVQNDVLLIDSAAKTVKLNGALDYANVGTTSQFPTLAPGNNTVSGRTCLDADATLSATWWSEYEA